MSWIKENTFLASLAGGTLVGAIALFFLASQGSKKYSSSKESFDLSYEEASLSERLPLYPNAVNRDSKSTALELYKKAVDGLQAAFEPFRPKEIKNITTQEFTTVLLNANTEVQTAFKESGISAPEALFLGFERYKSSLASAENTGILSYQLGSIKSLMLQLAKAKPKSLDNLYRPALSEEGGQKFTPTANAVSRPLPLEITFTGSERSVREFLASISKTEGYFVVIRTMRLSSTKKDAPKVADAKFDAPLVKEGASSESDSSGGFVLPGETPAEPTKPAAPAVMPSSRVLSQVLGNEDVQVFLRLDLLQFLPAKKLP